jgi:hypothetical protein
MRRPVLLLCLALLAGCRERPPSRITADSGAGIAVDPQTVPGRVALELWSLRPGIRLGEWSQANLNDLIAPADTQVVAEYFGDWCAVSTRVSELAGRRVIRQAYFYAPEPPPDRALPAAPSADLVRDCALGVVWVRVPVADSADGVRLADSVRAQLAAVYGDDTSRVSFWGSAYWSAVGHFRHDGSEAVSALRTTRLPVAGSDSLQAWRDVSAFAALPLSGVSFGAAREPEGVSRARVADRLALDSAARATGLDTALSAPLLRLYARAESVVPLADWRPAPGDSLVLPLRRWVDAAAELPPPRRAAALYVADRVLARAQCSFQLCLHGDSAALAPLRALGAEFVYSELGGGWGYARTWLAQARALDRDSPLGQRIFLEQLEAGFDFSGVCQGGAEAFRRVIEMGERYLERVPASPIHGAVHLGVADGYRDIVALADGAAGIYADSSAYVPQRDSARTRALAHYREAIAADRAAPAAAEAWRRAWWLLAGLPARGVRYYCIYD